MIEAYEVGSISLEESERERFLLGTKDYNSGIHSDARNYFERKVVEGFIDKIKKGEQDIPKYPQFRHMNLMFLETFDGIEKIKGGYGGLVFQSQNPKIPEVSVIEENSNKIHERIGKPFRMGVCVTGPYTLSLSFPKRTQYLDCYIFEEIGNALSKIVENNIFSNKYGRVEMIAVDEPSLGLPLADPKVGDPRLDYGSKGREILLKVYENIFHIAKSRNVKTIKHIHNSRIDIPWNIKSLDIIESDVDDSLYKLKRTKELLEEKDKFLKASIGKTKLLSPESKDVMEKRLVDIVNRFGEERVSYAGLECGLGDFPSPSPNYELEIKYLKMSADVIHSFKPL